MGYYDRYRGSRRKRRNRFTIILLVLLLLVVIAGAALFYLQDKAIFTSDGFRFPFFQDEKPEKEPPAEPSPDEPEEPEDIELEILGPDGLPEDEPDEPAPIEPVITEQVQALLTDGAAFLADPASALQRAQNGAFSQLALQIKSPEGIFLLDDGLIRDGVSPDAPAFAKALEQTELPKIAVISSLRDNIRPRQQFRSSALHTESGATWLDREYISWFDPEGEDTLSSLTAAVSACEAAGFDQVVLQNFHYPIAGRLELIDYSLQRTRQSAIIELAHRLRESTGTALGLVLTEAASTELLDGASGQDVPELAQYFDVLYVPASDFTRDVSAVQKACEGTYCRVGLYLTQPAEVPEDFALDYIIAQ